MQAEVPSCYTHKQNKTLLIMVEVPSFKLSAFLFTAITVVDLPLKVHRNVGLYGSLMSDTDRQKQVSHF